ncbi:MAG: hypothetical protein JHC81_04780 [Brevundimonas sp.]|uniref:hypothetical protein n=1 Tax=Brevundimonas sp. TaxID=1871086 RepID=UPI001A2F3960|nr:hypothetical protein [Brevundimonas sp.]MBJ7446829.1 hypothetical protein [Brevundimonas sp.]
MPQAACHAEVSTEPVADDDAPPADARDLVIRVLTVRRIAGWCCVSEGAVHQWLCRGTDDAPIPAKRVPVIAAGAAKSGLDFDVGMLWPAMSGMRAKAFGGLRAGAAQ